MELCKGPLFERSAVAIILEVNRKFDNLPNLGF